jgi:hypothetical protein
LGEGEGFGSAASEAPSISSPLKNDLLSSDELEYPCVSFWALAVIGSDAKAMADTAMAKRRNNVREGLQRTTIDPSSFRVLGLRGITPFLAVTPLGCFRLGK